MKTGEWLGSRTDRWSRDPQQKGKIEKKTFFDKLIRNYYYGLGEGKISRIKFPECDLKDEFYTIIKV